MYFFISITHDFVRHFQKILLYTVQKGKCAWMCLCVCVCGCVLQEKLKKTWTTANEVCGMPEVNKYLFLLEVSPHAITYTFLSCESCWEANSACKCEDSGNLSLGTSSFSFFPIM